MLRAEDLKQGASLGRYEIIRKLAVGGMAEIYLARVRGTAGFEKLVVLKRISPVVADDQGFVQMFLDEARLAATLRHPNIADVFDVGTEDSSYYFAMEFIHGQDARSIRLEANERGKQIPLEVALAITSGTSYALAYAHAKTGPSGPLDIVHRDVSPSNILVSYDGAVKLVDFGIARAEIRTTAKTRTGMLKGKVPYMSPEQTRGQVLDRRSDIFSLGTVLYEMTCGVRPFEGHSEYDTLETIVSARCERPSALVPGYLPELERIVLRMLARDPVDRYQTADDVLADLEKLFSDAGLLVSERVVAKYMREMFAGEIEEWEQAQANIGDPPTIRDDQRPHSQTTPWGMRVKRSTLSLDLDATTPLPASPNPRPPSHLDDDMQPLLVMPEVQVFVRRSGTTVPPPIEEPKSPERPPPPIPTRPSHWPRVPMPDRGSSKPIGSQTRTQPSLKQPDFQDESPTIEPEDTLPAEPRRARPTDFIDESPTTQSPRGAAARAIGESTKRMPLDQTRLDSLLGFDPIVERGDDLLAEIDAGAPAAETDEERATRRIAELGARIGAWVEAGDLMHAVVAAELALEEHAAGRLAQRALEAEQPALHAAFEAWIGDPARVARLGRATGELALSPGARLLVSRVDGVATYEDLLATPGLSPFEARRWLAWLLLRKLIVTA
jgi:serine/threonine protein kinase